MRFSSLLLLATVPLLVIGLLFYFPRCDHAAIEADLLSHYRNIELSSTRTTPLNDDDNLKRTSLFPIMTFNIRHDIPESDPNNLWKYRIHRAKDVIERWSPFVVGLQEPFGAQVHQLLSVLPKRYRPIDGMNSGDYRVGMLYDSESLELVDRDFIWLSKTPRVFDSKDWNSFGPRALNIAVFRLKKNAVDRAEILVFNTHLDVGSEEARRRQAEIVARTIAEWQQKYPKAVTFLTGDFNTAPGQVAYLTLTTNTTLNDAWITCKQNSNSSLSLLWSHQQKQHPQCLSNSVVPSFHGWKGSVVNSYGVRPLQAMAFTLHGMGFELRPRKIPETWREFIEIMSNVVEDRWRFSILEAIPTLPWSRLHVDWILYSGKNGDASTTVTPRVVLVADVRDSNYSSDHFPIVGVFEITRNS